MSAYSSHMENEDREFRRTCEEEEEYCTDCHTVYVTAEGCWCVEQDANPGIEKSNSRARSAGII